MRPVAENRSRQVVVLSRGWGCGCHVGTVVKRPRSGLRPTPAPWAAGPSPVFWVLSALAQRRRGQPGLLPGDQRPATPRQDFMMRQTGQRGSCPLAPLLPRPGGCPPGEGQHHRACSSSQAAWPLCHLHTQPAHRPVRRAPSRRTGARCRGLGRGAGGLRLRGGGQASWPQSKEGELRVWGS